MLNKKGWGLREMLVLSGVLLIFLAVAIYYIYNLYSDLDKEVSISHYQDLEKKLEANAKTYLEDYYDDILTSDYITISRSVLKVYDLDVDLSDRKGNACSGYVRANKSEAIVNVKAYISCEKYETDGYESWRE